jgi:hypothetical protein
VIIISKNNSKKEYLFAIFIKLNKKILEEELGVKIITIHLEKWFKNRKVDMNCIDVDGGRVLIEWQMDVSSNQTHYEQIQTLIEVANKNEKTTIVYGGLELKEEIISELMRNLVLCPEKNIQLVFLRINYDLLSILIDINNMDEINRIKELDRLKEIDKIFVDKKGISICNSKNTVSAEIEDNNISYEEKLIISLIKRLRVDSWDISTNVHQYKKINGGFTLGAGFDDITFRVFCSRKRTVGIKLVLGSKKTKELFYTLLKKKDILDSEFNYILKWDELHHTISSYYPISCFYRDTQMMVNRLCREIRLYLIVFYGYLKEAIEEHTD